MTASIQARALGDMDPTVHGVTPRRPRLRVLHLANVGDITWMADARCKGVDPDVFFGDHDIVTPEAAAICSACNVRARCGEYAIARTHLTGIWGGMTHSERRRERRRRWRTTPKALRR